MICCQVTNIIETSQGLLGNCPFCCIYGLIILYHTLEEHSLFLYLRAISQQQQQQQQPLGLREKCFQETIPAKEGSSTEGTNDSLKTDRAAA